LPIGAVEPDRRVRDDRKNATIQAQTSEEQGTVSRTQMMINGAIATIGVTWRITA